MFYRLFQHSISFCLIFVLTFFLIPSSSAKPPLNDYQKFLKETEQEKYIEPNLHFKPFQILSGNHHPIILVHGLGGWGKDEMFGFRYWGGLRDTEKDLLKNGFDVYTAAVGPLSSNWDRAVELYAQIKGGRVDYGEAHPKKHQHARFGRTYAGFYSQWDEEHPIHLLSHSMGGQTVRVLDQLLEKGSESERKQTDPDQVSPLFQGGKSWVHSITTIGSPHNGSPFTYAMKKLFPHIQRMVALAAAATGHQENPVYDFKLDQWGLKRESGETFWNYMERVGNSAIWDTSDDTSDYDLSPEGARELNTWVKSYPDKYYFSVSAEQTFRNPLTGFYLPEPFMNPLFIVPSIKIGRFTQYTPGMVIIDSSWWENDGLVSTSTMNGPKTESIIPFGGKAVKGKWNDLGVMNSFDHLDLIGFGVRDMRDWYRDLAGFLYSLQ